MPVKPGLLGASVEGSGSRGPGLVLEAPEVRALRDGRPESKSQVTPRLYCPAGESREGTTLDACPEPVEGKGSWGIPQDRQGWRVTESGTLEGE